MKRLLTLSAAALMAGSAYAGPWDNYSESDSSAFHRDYFADSAIAGQPGGGDATGRDRIDTRRVGRDDILSWDNYSERDSTAFHRDFLAERDSSVAGQPGVGDTSETGMGSSHKVEARDVLSWDNYSERDSSAFHRDSLGK